MKKKWQCDNCGDTFKTKKELVEHLTRDFEEASMDADAAQGQLDELGVKDPYK